MLQPSSKLIGTILALCTAAHASTINLGLVSYDVFISATSSTPQVDAFNITNFTGDNTIGGFDLPPDFPVATFVTFTNASLTIVDQNGSNDISLGDLGPGPLAPPNSLQFPDSDPISSAMFSATLDQTTLLLADGSTYTVDDAQIQAYLFPSIGPSLQAGTDSVLVTVSAENIVPEPSTAILVALGLAALVFRIRKNLRLRGVHHEN